MATCVPVRVRDWVPPPAVGRTSVALWGYDVPVAMVTEIVKPTGAAKRRFCTPPCRTFAAATPT